MFWLLDRAYAFTVDDIAPGGVIALPKRPESYITTVNTVESSLNICVLIVRNSI